MFTQPVDTTWTVLSSGIQRRVFRWKSTPRYIPEDRMYVTTTVKTSNPTCRNLYNQEATTVQWTTNDFFKATRSICETMRNAFAAVSSVQWSEVASFGAAAASHGYIRSTVGIAKSKYQDKNLPQRHSAHHKSHKNPSGSEPGTPW